MLVIVFLHVYQLQPPSRDTQHVDVVLDLLDEDGLLDIYVNKRDLEEEQTTHDVTSFGEGSVSGTQCSVADVTRDTGAESDLEQLEMVEPLHQEE